MRVDCHTHILPQMDDGSRSVDMSLEMLREEARQGVGLVICTPHFYAAQNDIPTFLARRQQAWERLQPHLTGELPRIRLGAEVQYFEGIAQAEELPRLRIQGSRFLLLEMPFRKWSDRMLRDVLELQDPEELQIIIAHIERYLHWQPRGIEQVLADNGLLIQSNAEFFRSWKTRHRALSMVRHGTIHLLASDCHNLTSRAPNLAEAYEVLGSRAEALAWPWSFAETEQEGITAAGEPMR